MICLNSQTALDEAFPRVGDRGLFSTFLDLRLRGSVLYLVGSSFQIIWDERVEAPPAVGATTPPLLDGYFPSIRLLVIFAKLCLSHTLPLLGCPIDSQNIPSSAGSRTPSTSYFVSSNEI